MSRFRSRPVEIEATQWFKDGDHHAVQFLRPGATSAGLSNCWALESVSGWQRVEPGDWIIAEPLPTSAGSGWYACRPEVFNAKYEAMP